MAKTEIKSEIELEFSITLTLTLQETRALNEMVKYGTKSFLEGYYKQLGKSYLQPYEKGVYSLFETINKELPDKLKKVDEMIVSINEIKFLW